MVELSVESWVVRKAGWRVVHSVEKMAAQRAENSVAWRAAHWVENSVARTVALRAALLAESWAVAKAD